MNGKTRFFFEFIVNFSMLQSNFNNVKMKYMWCKLCKVHLVGHPTFLSTNWTNREVHWPSKWISKWLKLTGKQDKITWEMLTWTRVLPYVNLPKKLIKLRTLRKFKRQKSSSTGRWSFVHVLWLVIMSVCCAFISISSSFRLTET